MRGLPPQLTAELLKEANALAHMVVFHTSPTVRYCDLDVDLYHESNWYYARGFEFSEIECSLATSVDQITLSIDNTDLVWSGIVMNQEIRTKRFDLFLAAIGDTARVIASSQLFAGIIDSAEIDDQAQRATITIVSPMIYWKRRIPRRNHSPACFWQFKGVECGYDGTETWCDQSWERCAALANKVNFGGFRWLPGLADKEVWWGKVPK